MAAISISEAYKFSYWKHASNKPSKNSFRFVCLIKPLEIASLNNSSWNVVFGRLCPVVAVQRMQIWRITRWASGTSYMKARLVGLRKVMGDEVGKNSYKGQWLKKILCKVEVKKTNSLSTEWIPLLDLQTVFAWRATWQPLYTIKGVSF